MKSLRKTGSLPAWPPVRSELTFEPLGRLTPPVAHLSPQELAELRQSLIDRRRKLVAEISRLQNEAYRTEESGQTGGASDEASGAVGAAGDPWQRVLRLRGIAHKRGLVHEIDQALGRIEKKTYGFCTETNKAISISRLREIPWARCI